MKLYELIELPSVIVIFFMALIFWANQVISSDDQYLQALEAEANSAVVEDNQKPVAANTGAGNVGLQNKQKKEFETRLLNELPATYKTYRMLEDQDKRKVIEVYYRSDRNMLVTTRLLFDLYFKVK